MSIQIIRKNEQAKAQFNDGKIEERKPIGLPKDKGPGEPYSILFYWVYGEAIETTEIEEHLHKGFEILSFVLHGELEHYDNNYKGWKKLTAGDVQVMKSRNGMTHAEKIYQGTSVFQIWLDPDLSKSINKESEYKNYSSDKFPVRMEEGKSIKVYCGEGSPMNLDSPQTIIREVSLAQGNHLLSIQPGHVLSVFILEGESHVNDYSLSQGDFFIIYNQKRLNIQSDTDSRFFIIESPRVVPYETYRENLPAE